MIVSLGARISRLLATTGFGTVLWDSIHSIGITTGKQITLAAMSGLAAMLGVIQHQFAVTAASGNTGDVIIDPPTGLEPTG